MLRCMSCGRYALVFSTFLGDFEPCTIKMAKDQNFIIKSCKNLLVLCGRYNVFA